MLTGLISVCAIEHTINDSSDTLSAVIPIAGDLLDFGGKALDAQWTLLSNSPSHSDSQKEGLRVELNGGIYEKKAQKAIVELICDRNRTGLEHDFDPEDKYLNEKRKRDEEKGDQPAVEPSLTFLEYDTSKETDILRLQWKTKYACENSRNEDSGDKSQHWGFFTWFIIMLVIPYTPESFTDANLCAVVDLWQRPRTLFLALG
jgi:hypothetical protein